MPEPARTADAARAAPLRPVRLGVPTPVLERRADGCIVVRTREPLGPCPANLIEPLRTWAERAPDRVFLAQRDGDGGWRRLTYAQVLATVQRIGAALLKPGGALVHIVCSLLDEEGQGQVAAFLADHPDWQAEPLSLATGTTHGAGVRLTPAADGTDGFFVARLVRPC